MDSSQLREVKKNLSDWRYLNRVGLERAPTEFGVYIIRLAGRKAFGRLKGSSDILYIGSSRAKGGLKARLGFFLHPGSTQWTSRRINDCLQKYQMEIAWFSSKNPREQEENLLKQYLLDHDELPPLNRASPKRLCHISKRDTSRKKATKTAESNE